MKQRDFNTSDQEVRIGMEDIDRTAAEFGMNWWIALALAALTPFLRGEFYSPLSLHFLLGFAIRAVIYVGGYWLWLKWKYRRKK